MASPTVDQLRDALAQAGDLLGRIGSEQWGAATPCEDWDVHALVSHVVTGNRLFAAALRGEPAPAPAVDDDLVAAFAQSATDVVAAFAEPGALDRIVRVPFGTVPATVALHLRISEILVHGWDLARATGQAVPFDDAVAEQELGFSHASLGAIPPDRRPFAAPKPAPPDSSALVRLVALLGRDVSGAAPGPR
jgi:uncharacterized protein (TIGR03086 family)